MREERADYRHARRLAALVILAVIGAATVRWLLVPSSFGYHGHHRAEAPAEAAAREPRHQGEAACARCHPKQVALHDKDAHARVPCEDCHGEGMEHAQRRAAMKIPRGKQACLVCHQQLTARVSFFPQIEVAAHFRAAGVKDQSIACTTCHDPHEPLYMDRDLRTARLHPLVHRCRDCHTGASRDPATPRPAGHPAIFQCNYCHKAIAADFASRKHHQVQCTTCHIFFKESEFAGRILRDADPRFCLLCHGEGSFRDPKKAPPGIVWPQHREEMGGAAGARCIDCHRDRIHLTAAALATEAAARAAHGGPAGGAR